MRNKNWTTKEIDALGRLYKQKPEWLTDNAFAEKVVRTFKGRSKESIRWQVRNFHSSFKPKPLEMWLMDIETMPILGYVWSPWQQNMYKPQVEKDWSVLSWAAGKLYDKKVEGQIVTPEEAVEHNDESVIHRIWEILNTADVIVTMNGDKFDFLKLNARFVVHGLPKPMYYKSIDMYKVFKYNFKFTYNSMDWVAELLGAGRKIPTDFYWWKQCAHGDEKTLKDMLKYNKQDIKVLEDVYLKLRPWIGNHPNLALYSYTEGNHTVCPTCTSPNLHWKGQYATALGLYEAFRCEECGSIGRSTRKKYKLAGSEIRV